MKLADNEIGNRFLAYKIGEDSQKFGCKDLT